MSKCEWCGKKLLFFLNTTKCPDGCIGPKITKGSVTFASQEIADSYGVLWEDKIDAPARVLGLNAKHAYALLKVMLTGSSNATPGRIKRFQELCPAVESLSITTDTWMGQPRSRAVLRLNPGKGLNNLPHGVCHMARDIYASNGDRLK
jgi:hypothetical protein